MRLLILALLLAGCPANRAPPVSDAPMPTIADPQYLTQSLWDDGKAEVAFYRGWFIEQNGEKRTFEVGTYLIKHSFDVQRMTKADQGGIPDFKWALFFEFVAGSEQFKHSYVINAAQADLRPLKISSASFDWCSNQYRELAFLPGQKVRRLMRSDDYGNVEATFDFMATSYGAQQVPLLVRAIDFETAKQRDFEILHLDGTYVGAVAELVGEEKIEVPAGTVDAEKIVVFYASSTQSLFETPTQKEIYWRAKTPERHLLKMTQEGDGYGLELLESVRSAYWQENVFSRLSRVSAHP